MSKSLNSPTSRLLQSSRFFSLPRPLPQPSLETATSTGIYRASDSATLPYPTHQTIVTPASSHSRGDWGLKRALPLKATRNTSTPHIRVRQHDNAAHITDFGSAADHSLTLKKWEQMGVPLLVSREKKSYTQTMTTNQSVYDEDLDHTNANRMGRWKYAGPWLPGMKEGEFELWVTTAISKRKAEFREFLTQRMLKKRIQQEQKALRDAGEARSISELRRVQLRKEVEESFELEEKKMRDEHTTQHLSSDMTAAICDFLDLPGIIRGQDSERFAGVAQTHDLQMALGGHANANVGPPSTHPGAGLSHIRSAAYLENHPLWGPQLHRAPVLSRVLRYRNNANGTEVQAKLGVGGVVANDPVQSAFNVRPNPNFPEPLSDIYKDVNQMIHAIEPDLPGGNKIWVHPQAAYIDEDGRIKMQIVRGDREAIAVKEGNVEQIHEARSTAAQSVGPSAAFAGRYGTALGLGQRRSNAPVRSFTEGFSNEEVGRSPAQNAARTKEEQVLANLRELARSPSSPRR